MQSHQFTTTNFRANDIRGVVDKTLNDEDAYFIGRCYGTLLKRKYNRTNCVVGYDGRPTSPLYAKKLIKGLSDCGINVTNIGLVPTPVVYFSIHFLQKESGVIITASHNPPEYNGFKFLTNDGPIWGQDIQQLLVYANDGDYESGHGDIQNIDVKSNYVEYILKHLTFNSSNLKVAWDPGNGTFAVLIKEFASKLPGTHITICDTLDSRFPNHHPDPSVESNLEMLKKAVLDNHCDFGVGFDGDGDRLGVVDGQGRYIYGDILLAILARDFLKNHPGEKVMCEVKSSQVLFDDITKLGGVPVLWKPGHSALKSKMKSDNIKIAGETSGHMLYGENHNYDDAMFAAIKLMNYLENHHLKLSEVFDSFPHTFATPEKRIDVGDDRKWEIVKEIKERLTVEGQKFVEIDGIRVNCDSGWWLVRASNTQPDITIRCEAISEKELTKYQQKLEEQLRLSKVQI